MMHINPVSEEMVLAPIFPTPGRCAASDAPRDDDTERTLESLYRAYAQPLRGFARRRVGRHEAEDLVQDVYLRLLQFGETSKLERPREYLYRVAANLAVDAARKLKVRARYAGEDADLSNACDGAANPERMIEISTELRRLREALDDLSPSCREAFLLSRFGNLTHVEIADRQGVSVRTIERRMADAQKRLQARLGLTAEANGPRLRASTRE